QWEVKQGAAGRSRSGISEWISGAVTEAPARRTFQIQPVAWRRESHRRWHPLCSRRAYTGGQMSAFTRWSAVAVTSIALLGTVAFAQARKPRVVIVATGGTIAGAAESTT